jgi:Hepatocellular carcinoma-associated antigen 59
VNFIKVQTLRPQRWCTAEKTSRVRRLRQVSSQQPADVQPYRFEETILGTASYLSHPLTMEADPTSEQGQVARPLPEKPAQIEQPAPSVVATNRFAAKKANLRKRRQPDEGFGAGSDDEEDTGKKLANINDIKEEQKLRAKPKGLDAATLLTADTTKTEEQLSAATSAEPSAAPVGLRQSGGAGKSEFGSGFTAQLGGELFNGDDPLMRAYIEKRMKEELMSNGGKGSVAATDSSNNGPAAKRPKTLEEEERWLYQLPDHLNPAVIRKSLHHGGSSGAGPINPHKEESSSSSSGTSGSAAEDGTGTGGMIIAGGLGIQEVALPSSFIQKNLIETQRAAQALNERRQVRGAASIAMALGAGADVTRALPGGAADDDALDGSGAPGSRFLIGNLSSNFRLHNREFAIKMREQHHSEGAGGGAAGNSNTSAAAGPTMHHNEQRSGFGGSAAGSALAATGEGVGPLLQQLKGGGGGGGGHHLQPSGSSNSSSSGASASAGGAPSHQPHPHRHQQGQQGQHQGHQRRDRAAYADDDAAFKKFKERELKAFRNR